MESLQQEVATSETTGETHVPLHCPSDCFSDFYVKYQRPVCALLHSWGFQDADVADISQQTFSNAYEHWDQLQCREKEKSWVMAIARRAMLMYLRDHKSKELPTISAPECVTRESTPSVLTTLLASEERILVQKAFASLNQQDRDIFQVHVIEEQSEQQTCVTLRLTPRMMRERYFWARQHLKQALMV